jgi:beta-lactam-binding protein with PASTA domain
MHLFPPSSPIATVPYVTGATLSSASSELQHHGFHNIPYLYNCYGSPDFDDVVQQDPGARALIAVTDPVHLYLQAQNCSTVPSVIGMNLSNAADALHGAGFSNIPWVDGCYGSSEISAVVAQSPAAGTSYGKNQAVSLKLQAKNC